MKLRLKGARTGHSLLKRKAEALTRRFREIVKQIQDAKIAMGKVLQEASFAYSQVQYSAGDISFQVCESVKTAQLKVKARQENVSGVMLPAFDFINNDSQNTFELAGLGRGGAQIAACKEAYSKAVAVLVELASMQSAFVILDEIIKLTNRRVNAIEHENTIHYITSELDEMDREEFFRQVPLKKVQEKKKGRKEAQELLDAANAESLRAKMEKLGTQHGAAVTDMLGQAEDPDVIF
ncbi:MAG: hypothetical protein SGCHY_005390 [Lobulomycetales sp.]